MVKDQLSFHWYFGNKICIGKKTTRMSLVNNQLRCKDLHYHQQVEIALVKNQQSMVKKERNRQNKNCGS